MTALAVAALGTVAEAKGEWYPWASSASPLVVEGYGSTGYGYGSFKVDDFTGTVADLTDVHLITSSGGKRPNGTLANFGSNIWMKNADDHKVYVEEETWTNSGYCYQPDYTSCNQEYYLWAATETLHTDSESRVHYDNQTSVNPSANYARGRVRMRLDIPWRTDPASGWLVTHATKY